jgi:hypothetical protein
LRVHLPDYVAQVIREIHNLGRVSGIPGGVSGIRLPWRSFRILPGPGSVMAKQTGSEHDAPSKRDTYRPDGALVSLPTRLE